MKKILPKHAYQWLFLLCITFNCQTLSGTSMFKNPFAGSPKNNSQKTTGNVNNGLNNNNNNVKNPTNGLNGGKMFVPPKVTPQQPNSQQKNNGKNGSNHNLSYYLDSLSNLFNGSNKNLSTDNVNNNNGNNSRSNVEDKWIDNQNSTGSFNLNNRLKTLRNNFLPKNTTTTDNNDNKVTKYNSFIDDNLYSQSSTGSTGNPGHKNQDPEFYISNYASPMPSTNKSQSNNNDYNNTELNKSPSNDVESSSVIRKLSTGNFLDKINGRLNKLNEKEPITLEETLKARLEQKEKLKKEVKKLENEPKNLSNQNEINKKIDFNNLEIERISSEIKQIESDKKKLNDIISKIENLEKKFKNIEIGQELKNKIKALVKTKQKITSKLETEPYNDIKNNIGNIVEKAKEKITEAEREIEFANLAKKPTTKEPSKSEQDYTYVVAYIVIILWLYHKFFVKAN